MTNFGVAEIGQGQAQDYAERKGWTLEETEKWIVLNLAYDSEQTGTGGEVDIPQIVSKAKVQCTMRRSRRPPHERIASQNDYTEGLESRL